MVRARKASLQVKSSEFERQLGAQKLEEANRRQVEKRRNMMQECELVRGSWGLSAGGVCTVVHVYAPGRIRPHGRTTMS